MNRIWALLLVIALVGAACGGRDGDDATPTTTTTVAVTQDADDSPTEPDDTPVVEDPAVMIGTLASPCAAGDASGATDTGVSDDKINVAVFSDHTNDIAPGLNVDVYEAVEAFVAWCNDQGGIEGRPVETELFESKLFEANQRAAEICESDVFVALGAGALDNDSVNTLADCGVPYLAAFTGSKPAIESPAAFPAIPTPFVSHAAGEGFWFAEQFPAEIENAGILFASFASSVQIAARAQVAYEQAGFNFIHEGTHNPQGETNWTPVMQPFKEAGVEVIVSMAQTEFTAAFMLAAAEQDYFPIVLANSANFTDDLITIGGEAVEGVYTYTGSAPIGEAIEGSATQFYLDLLADYGDDAQPALLGINSLASTVLFAHTAAACGSELTRDCLRTGIEGLDSWDTGGLHGPTNPGAREGTACYMVLQVIDGEWARISPSEGLDCDPTNVVDTDIDYGE